MPTQLCNDHGRGLYLTPEKLSCDVHRAGTAWEWSRGVLTLIRRAKLPVSQVPCDNPSPA